MNQKESNLLFVGTIVNTHGLKGEVRVLIDLEHSTEIFSIGKKIYYYDNDLLCELNILTIRHHKQFVLLTFEKYTNINDIEWIKGKEIYIQRKKLMNNQYYLSDLIGLEVFDQSNSFIGKVYQISNNGKYNNLEISLNNGRKTNIPMVDEFKIEFSKTANNIKVKIPREFII